MMLTPASQLATRARCARVGASWTLGPSGTVFTRHRQQQARGFRFGRIWSSHFGYEPHRDTCRRHRKFRSKYAESMNRRLVGDKHPLADDAKAAFRQIVHDCWHPFREIRSTSRYGTTQRTPDNPTGVRPGQTIEDAEREPMAHFLFGDKDGWAHPFMGLRDLMADEEIRDKAASSHYSDSTVVDKVEYVIDPITNRKRPKSSSDVSNSNAANETPQFFGQGFATFDPTRINGEQTPIFYDGPPQEAELRKYDRVKIDSRPWDRISTRGATQQESPSNQQRQPIFESEEYVQNHSSSTSSVRDGQGSLSGRYNGIFWHRSDGVFCSANKDDAGPWSLNPEYFGYNDLHKYKPVMEAEPQPDEEPQNYDDLHNYGAFRYLEPDGKPLVEDKSTTAVTKEDQSSGHSQSEVKLARPDESQVDPTELNKYQAVRYNEPDGQTADYQEPQVQQSELDKYQKVMHNEPDGKLPSAEEYHSSCTPEELSKYQPVMHKELDEKPPGHVEQDPVCDPAELQKYGPFMYLEPDGKTQSDAHQESVPASGELSKYGPVFHKTLDGPATTAETESPNPAELNKYTAVRWNEPDGKPMAESVESPHLSELGKYKAVKWNEPDGQPTEEQDPGIQSLEEFELASAPGEGEQASKPIFHRAYPARGGEKEKQREELDSLMTQNAVSSDAVDAKIVASLKTHKASRDTLQEKQLSGNYVRDFPEEFATSWTSLLAEKPPTAEESTDTSSAVLQSALDRQLKSGRLLSRKAAAQSAVLDPYSQEPQGLETSYAEECAGQSTWPTYTKTYGSLSSEPDSMEGDTGPRTTGAVGSTAPEPTLYKILAYDPTMQTITTADTTSIVSDKMSPLTPAEVLLRLSNPVKFLPHFGPLEAQGFEIVSGSGDVLVFRKVRPATHEPVQQDSPSAATPASTISEDPNSAASPPPVNPIDMTGEPYAPSPATSRFASPTGFVNYDLPPLRESSEPVTPFASGIDVKREEPVFSGQKSRKDHQSRASLPKRVVVGAVWVAGVSYALGVVGEYFATGGTDGMGPKGL